MRAGNLSTQLLMAEQERIRALSMTVGDGAVVLGLQYEKGVGTLTY